MALETSTSGSPGPATTGSATGGDTTGAPSGPIGTQAPTIIDLTHDSMVRLPGAKDPVKYGDYYRGFQSEFTRKSQEAAALTKQFEQTKRVLAEREAQLKRLDDARGNQAQRTDIAAKLRSLSYLSGEDAASVVEHLTGQIDQFSQALQQRDVALGLMYKRLQEMGGQFQTLSTRSSMGDFETKIKAFVKSQGLPEAAEELAKEIYLAYEGDDLDHEFPAMLKNRWTQIENLVRASDKARAAAARGNPFVPGKGGNGSPSKPLKSFAKASAKEIADELWPGAVDGGVET